MHEEWQEKQVKKMLLRAFDMGKHDVGDKDFEENILPKMMYGKRFRW